MIKKAETKEIIEAVKNYLERKGTRVNTEVLHYTATEIDPTAEVIRGAYGIENKVCIEPLQSDGKVITLQLFTDALATVRTLGYKQVHILTASAEVSEALQQEYGARVWGEGLQELIIDI